MYEVKPVGRILSSLTSLDDCPLQESESAPGAKIEIFAEFMQAAQDLKAGDNIILFTWLNLADRTVLTTHPRNNPASKLKGVFSTRSPHRPNPMGIHFVEIVKIHPGNIIEVANLEVLDQTPVIDIKIA